MNGGRLWGLVVLGTALIGGGAAPADAQEAARPESAASATAPSAPRPQIQVNVGAEAPRGAEARHLRTLVQAYEAIQRQGYAGLRPRRADLRRALDAAPDRYPAVEQTDRRWIVRSDDLTDAILMASLASAAANQSGQTTIDVVQQPNVYPMIAFLLGSEAVERQAYDEAIGYLDRGLALQPNNVMLTAEKAASLHGQEKWAEALTVVDAALASEDLLVIVHSAPLHRRRGSSLLGLGRLADAKAAFQASLESEPDNPAALNELAYIAELEAGGPARQSVLVAGPQPASE